MTNLNSMLKSRDITVSTKIHIVKAMVCPVVMYRCERDHKEAWAPNNEYFQIVVWEKTLESPWDWNEINPVNPKGHQSWIFTGRTVAEAEAPVLWSPDAKSQLTGKDFDARKDWRQQEKEVAEDEMVGWHHRPMDKRTIWANSRRERRTEEPHVLQSMGWQIDTT